MQVGAVPAGHPRTIGPVCTGSARRVARACRRIRSKRAVRSAAGARPQNSPGRRTPVRSERVVQDRAAADRAQADRRGASGDMSGSSGIPARASVLQDENRPSADWTVRCSARHTARWAGDTDAQLAGAACGRVPRRASRPGSTRGRPPARRSAGRRRGGGRLRGRRPRGPRRSPASRSRTRAEHRPQPGPRDGFSAAARPDPAASRTCRRDRPTRRRRPAAC